MKHLKKTGKQFKEKIDPKITNSKNISDLIRSLLAPPTLKIPGFAFRKRNCQKLCLTTALARSLSKKYPSQDLAFC
jgi:hypothetical protein